MNYYNPYYMAYPAMSAARPGLFRGLLSNINFSSILSGTSKTLNVVNQAIPLVKQAGPIMKNAKTMFRVMNEFKKVDSPSKTNKAVVEKNQPSDALKEEIRTTTSGPTFFL
jgi:hypothetical protein